MKKEREILDEAINSLLRYTKIQAVVKDGRLRRDAILEIAKEEFAIEIKPEITKGNKGIVLAQLKEVSRENNLPIILITRYIPGEISKEYVDEGVYYLDVAGNCNIRQRKLMLLIEGKKIERIGKVNQPRAFQEAGIKLIFQFLVDPEKTQLPYRDLAGLANISLGSVGMIMQELTDLNFILKTKQTKKLKNTKDLLNRWITAYHDVMRPRLLKKQMRFINQDRYNKWTDINLEQTNSLTFWGGEPGAHLLTGYLHPGIFTIYTDRNWQNFKDIGLVPDDNGKVEVLEIFWDLRTWQGIPPVLIYADLMSSGSDRNIETANMIFKNELQYIK
ncbi:MAG: type IV toxin-antitoxin system AbiEi family antitoxin [Bacteroidota bacterium]